MADRGTGEVEQQEAAANEPRIVPRERALAEAAVVAERDKKLLERLSK